MFVKWELVSNGDNLIGYGMKGGLLFGVLVENMVLVSANLGILFHFVQKNFNTNLLNLI